MTLRHLDCLLTPNAVAVFGASSKPGRVGTTLWRDLLAGGFTRAVLQVNPRLEEFNGRRRYRDAGALPVVPDPVRRTRAACCG